MRRDRWNTYAEYAYSYSVAQKYDQRSTGGLHLHQVRKGFLFWKERILQANSGNGFL